MRHNAGHSNLEFNNSVCTQVVLVKVYVLLIKGVISGFFFFEKNNYSVAQLYGFTCESKIEITSVMHSLGSITHYDKKGYNTKKR